MNGGVGWEAEPVSTPNGPAASAADRIVLGGVLFDRLTEAQAVAHIIESIKNGQGGWMATPNTDICRMASKDRALRDLLASASLVVPDGMPLLWATRLRGDPLPERVTGASMIFSLSEAAADHGLSIYLLGGEPGVSGQAGNVLRRKYPGLVVTGTDSPDVDRDPSASTIAAVRARLAAAVPHIVYVGLGFPKQERLIAGIASALPGSWFISCGAAIPFAAGVLPRAPQWMQRSGLEWAFRLRSEPRRLFRRYVVDDTPYAAALLASIAWQRARDRGHDR